MSGDLEKPPSRARRVARFTDARSARPSWMRIVNAFGRLAPGTPRADPDRWWSQARRALREAEAPEEDARRALAALTESLESEGRLHLVGRLAARQDTVRLARNHLRLARLLRERPEILATELPPPIFIVGLPRTGTTFLHHLLACDERNRTLPYWESFDPIPPAAGPDRRPQQVARMLEQLARLAPDYAAIHPMSAEGPEECVALFMHALRTLQFDIQYHAPGYVRWLLAEDADVAYRAYERQLRVVQHFRPAGRHLLLKDPTHLVHLETLIARFPRARLVFTHRDPARSFSSICSLYAHTRAIFSDAVDPRALGTEIMEGYWPAALDRARSIRERLPPDRCADVRQSDLARDPIVTVRRVYGDLGLELDESAEASMNAFVHRESRSGGDVHEHRPETFGLTAPELRDRFRSYVEAFDL